MENVKFEDAGGFNKSSFDETPKLVKMVLKTGITESVAVANYILIGVAVVCVLVAGYFFTRGGTGNAPQINRELLDKMNQQSFTTEEI
jgi:hypothetical protein